MPTGGEVAASRIRLYVHTYGSLRVVTLRVVSLQNGHRGATPVNAKISVPCDVHNNIMVHRWHLVAVAM